MGISEIFTLILGVLQFPSVILALVKLLKATPQEKHEDILKAIAEEAKHYEDTGRPVW